ncbi:thymidine kinase [Actinosynnema pretiosum subsp. pretiosum]|uniref:Thymidine kinase n=2 Tax=Actinosynnema pretiosum TaxID=42197 RepID=A0A290Z706_9PSEU|nr:MULTISPECIES: thymidine kinase [Actinosynnema]ATE54817.1 thymidine kinase [Actinosynnema pretiosum]QUF05107.1 thymidine kinase [Actinosynnema pretiosum subsp. pretiosum]
MRAVEPTNPALDPTDALASVPAAGARRGVRAAGSLRFFFGPMDCGKSTLALQIDHNQARQGRCGLLLVRHDRSGTPTISSRMGLARRALEVHDEMDLGALVREHWGRGQRVDYLIVDEAQFLDPEQVDQLAELADDAQIDVYCFGLATDFRSTMFPGSRRLFELADELNAIQVEVLCWCGLPGRFNGRVHDDVLVRDGSTVLVADVVQVAADDVRYQVLCRKHYRTGDLGPSAVRDGQLSLT